MEVHKQKAPKAGYMTLKIPAYKPAIDHTEGTGSSAKIPAHVKRFNGKFQR